MRGMSGEAVRSLYIACVRPIMEYGIEVWFRPTIASQSQTLAKAQNVGLRRMLGAFRTTPVEIMEVEAGILPTKIRQ